MNPNEKPSLIAMTVDPELKHAVRLQAATCGISVSEWIRRLIKEKLNRVSNTQTKGER